MEIIIEDIAKTSQLMGKDFSDPERIAVLKCLESCDIQACPGSGKTTAMVAKIVILAQKLSGTYSGICALSHTNAAKDEIKKSLGPFVTMLFKYPNFISTIQVFADTFLAIPAYIQEYNKRPIVIDDETYEIRAKKYFSQLPIGTRNFLNYQTGGTGAEYFANISYAFENEKLVYFDGQDEKPFLAGENTASYANVLNKKKVLTSEGYLTYHDAFTLAHHYIGKFPSLSIALSKRFPFVFVDEMQDTDKYQLQLIDMIFAGKSILQKFGDPNQSIYGHRSNSFQTVWIPKAPITISSSKRLSASIAHLSQNLGIIPQAISGNRENTDHSHTVILYNQEKINLVIPTFGEIIQEQQLTDGPFVAVGAVGKLNENPDHTSIASYWPSFVNHRRINRTSVSFWDSISLSKIAIGQDRNFIKARDLLLHGVSIVLREQGNVTPGNINFTAQIIQREINKAGVEKTVNLNKVLLSWCQTLFVTNQIDMQEMLNYLNEIMKLLGFNLTLPKKTELESKYDIPLIIAEEEQKAICNEYRKDENILVTIDTIHSVKGQTHKATLLLETFYYQFDLELLIPYLHGDRLKKPGTRITNRFLPLAYVACTRPTHLLCLAILSEHMSNENLHLLEGYGWSIRGLTA
jgi:DNA helicase II / ATP-dependent DNA helicase PcrA